MLLRVIYRNGTAGMVKAMNIDELIKEGKIVVYKLGNRWIEVRRKQNVGYKGTERRGILPY